MNSKKYYAGISKGYNELYGEEQQAKYEIIKEYIQGKVLDVGCGTGIITKQILDAVGLDNSWEMLSQYEGEKELADAHEIPFPDKSFDTAISLTVLQDVEKPEIVLKEMKRVGKKVIFSILHKGKWTEEKLRELIKSAGLIGEIKKNEKDWFFIEETKKKIKKV